MSNVEMPQGAPAPRRAAMWIALSALVVVLGSWITVPGVDPEVLEALDDGGLFSLFGGATRLFGVIGLSISALVVVRVALALLGKRDSPVAKAAGAAVYLAISTPIAWALTIYAEALNVEVPFGDFVDEPGFRFRILAMLTWVAGAAIVWWLAERIDATRAASGALALAMIASLVRLFVDAGAAGSRWATGAATPGFALLHLAEPLAMAGAAVIVVVRPPAAWPIRISRDLELRSAFDLVAAPAAVALLAGDLALASALEMPQALTRALAAIATLIGLAVLVFTRVPKGAGQRRVWPLAAGGAALLLVSAPLVAGFVLSGGASRAATPGPLAGEARFELTLAAVDRFAPTDAEAMVERLASLGAPAEVVSASAERITLRVEGSRAQEEVIEALRPRTLALHLVSPLPAEALPAGVEPPAPHRPHAEGSCEVLRGIELPGCRAALGPVHEDASRCQLFCLDPQPVVTGADVVEASVVVDPYMGEPMVTVRLSDRATPRFARVTGENVERYLAIVVDSMVLSAPVIRSAIPHGRIQLTLGHAASPEALEREAAVLVAALSPGGRVRSAFTVESVR